MTVGRNRTGYPVAEINYRSGNDLMTDNIVIHVKNLAVQQNISLLDIAEITHLAAAVNTAQKLTGIGNNITISDNSAAQTAVIVNYAAQRRCFTDIFTRQIMNRAIFKHVAQQGSLYVQSQTILQQAAENRTEFGRIGLGSGNHRKVRQNFGRHIKLRIQKPVTISQNSQGITVFINGFTGINKTAHN